MSAAAVPNGYLGTSAFAARVLEILAASRHRPSLVITPPDRPAGRGRRLRRAPVAELATELGIELHQTAAVSEGDSLEALRAAGVEVGCVCAFGQLIKEPLLGELPMLNVHPSLLPRWRGAAPIERALIAGDERTGVCVMRLTAGLDSGPVALRRELVVGAAEGYESLSARLAELGGELLVEALDLHLGAGLRWTEQDDAAVTYAEKITSADRMLDPARPAIELERTVRALTPHIGAFLRTGEDPGRDRLGVSAARAVEGGDRPLGVGELATVGDEPPEPHGLRLLLGCGQGALELLEVQPPGKRPLPIVDYLRGNRPPARAALAERQPGGTQ